MKRFADQPLRERPHIAILFSEKVGGFVAITPLLKGLHKKYLGCIIDYFGGELTKDLETSSSLINSRVSMYGNDRLTKDLLEYISSRKLVYGGYDLVINLDSSNANRLIVALLEPSFACGPCFNLDLRSELPFLDNEIDHIWIENDWRKPEFLQRHGALFRTGFIGEIFCRLAYIDFDELSFDIPQDEIYVKVPDVLIGTSTTRSVKRWLTASWSTIIKWCTDKGLDVGLLGSHPTIEHQFYTSKNQEFELLRTTSLIDLRGYFTLPQVASALSRTRCCVAIDAGIMHLAAGIGTPTVAIFGNLTSPPRLWAPPVPNLRVVTSVEHCDMCEAAAFLNATCLRGDHYCMSQINPQMVIQAITSLI